MENHKKKFNEKNQNVKNNKENIKDRKTKDSNNGHLKNDKGKKKIKKENVNLKKKTKKKSLAKSSDEDSQKVRTGEAFIINEESVPSYNNKKKKHRRRYHQGRKVSDDSNKGHDTSRLLINLDTPAQRNVLSFGLKFIPTLTKINTTELVADCKKFARRMRLKELFHGKNYESKLYGS